MPRMILFAALLSCAACSAPRGPGLLVSRDGEVDASGQRWSSRVEVSLEAPTLLDVTPERSGELRLRLDRGLAGGLVLAQLRGYGIEESLGEEELKVHVTRGQRLELLLRLDGPEATSRGVERATVTLTMSAFPSPTITDSPDLQERLQGQTFEILRETEEYMYQVKLLLEPGRIFVDIETNGYELKEEDDVLEEIVELLEPHAQGRPIVFDINGLVKTIEP